MKGFPQASERLSQDAARFGTVNVFQQIIILDLRSTYQNVMRVADTSTCLVSIHCGILVLILVAAGASVGSAAPTGNLLRAIRLAHDELSAASTRVQGHIQIYRASGVLLTPEDVGQDDRLKLKLKGKLWRDGSKFRAEYTQHVHSADGTSRTVMVSDACDHDTYFEFGSSGAPKAMLHVAKPGSKQAAAVSERIQRTFIDPIDCLWSSAGNPIVDFLQRPGVVLNSSGAGDDVTCSIVLQLNPSAVTRYELDLDRGYSLKALAGTHALDGTIAQINAWYQSAPSEGSWLPKRLVKHSIIGDDQSQTSDTEIVLLDLRPLDERSTFVSEPITEASFRHLGIDYNVFTHSAADGSDGEWASFSALPKDAPRDSAQSNLLFRFGLTLFVVVCGTGLYFVLRRNSSRMPRNKQVLRQ